MSTRTKLLFFWTILFAIGFLACDVFVISDGGAKMKENGFGVGWLLLFHIPLIILVVYTWREYKKEKDPQPAKQRSRSAKPQPSKLSVGLTGNNLIDLLAIASAHPNGVGSQPERKEVKRIGQEANAAGGMRGMQRLHAEFSQCLMETNPTAYHNGWSRHLESLWDGIGEWQG